MTKVAKFTPKADVKLLANNTIRVNSNKPEYGSIMVIEESAKINNGFLNKKVKVGFITAKVEDLLSLDYKADQEVDFKIVHKETTNAPEGQGYRQKINPQTGEILCSGGKEIMWRTFVVNANDASTDEYIQHDSVKVPVAATQTERKLS